jgi:hypothetical protein
MSKRGITLAGILLVIAVAGCTKDDSADSRPELTRREKDSIIANSQIPGAKAVKKSMTSADSATARQTRLDSALNSP